MRWYVDGLEEERRVRRKEERSGRDISESMKISSHLSIYLSVSCFVVSCEVIYMIG
jgi:hypothetical protein